MKIIANTVLSEWVRMPVALICLLLITFTALAQEQAGFPMAPDSLFLTLRDDSRSGLEDQVGYFDDLIAYYDSIGDECKVAILCAKKGAIETNQGAEDIGIGYIQRAIKLNESRSCDGHTSAYILWAYSTWNEAMGEVEKSDSLAELGIRMYQESWDDKETLIGLYINRGLGFKAIEESISFLDTALELAVRYKFPKLEAMTLMNMGASYADVGEYSLAKKYFDRSLRMNLAFDNPSNIDDLYNNIAGVIAMQSDEYEPQVLSLLDSAIYFARKGQKFRSVLDLIENKAFYLRMTGQPDSAYSLLWTAHLMKDTLYNLAKYEAIAELQQRFEAEKRSNEIQALRVDNLNAEVKNLRFKRTQNRLIIGSIVLVFILVFLVYSFVVLRRNRNLLAHKNELIVEEQKRSNHLLLNILPEQVAEDLKKDGHSTAKKFMHATILFTDFINFTETSEYLKTEELVDELNTYFMKFDDIVEKYGIEKIKTIGDSYMAAGGLPIPDENTTKKAVLAALEMQQFVKERAAERRAENKVVFEMRAGVHTGNVVAGIVGKKKYQYDVWGDTVNTASRMETYGKGGKVNISKATYEVLKDDPDFVLQYRGKIEAKGKGEVDMYFVKLKERPKLT